MKLRELEAEFYRYEKHIADETRGKQLPDGTTQWGGFEADFLQSVPTLAEAQMIMFLCPLCFKKNNGSIGTHSVEVTFANRGVSDNLGSHNKEGRATRWNIDGGTDFDDLRLSPSILIESGCNWHGFIGNSGVPAGCAE